MKVKFFYLLFIALSSLAFVVNDFFVLEFPDYFPTPVYQFENNPLSKNKVELGRALFYDPILSKDNSISCASCHSPYNAFAHTDHDLSHGIDDQIGTRNAPTLFNLAWQKTFMWDGAINHLDMQALAPISHPKEMGEDFKNVVNKLQESPLYPQVYQQAFGDSIITGEHTLKAISQFMLTLVSDNSKYDKMIRGEIEFSSQEKNGYQLFQTNCASCHQEPLFTSGNFANNGLPVDTTLNDFGKMLITKKTTDSLQFKIPSLRNIEFSYPYMHDGRFRSLSQVLKHYDSGIQHSSTLSKELQKPMTLSSNEKVDLVAFLLTLSDKDFLFNPKHQFPRSFFFTNK